MNKGTGYMTTSYFNPAEDLSDWYGGFDSYSWTDSIGRGADYSHAMAAPNWWGNAMTTGSNQWGDPFAGTWYPDNLYGMMSQYPGPGLYSLDPLSITSVYYHEGDIVKVTPYHRSLHMMHPAEYDPSYIFIGIEHYPSYNETMW